LASKLLSEVLQARNRLLDADDKTEYDAQLREQHAAKPTRSVSEGQFPKPPAWPDGKAPSSVEEFHQCLEASRVMSADDSRRFLTSLPEGKRPDTPKNLTIELLKAGKLTRHQAESVLKGKIKFLAFGEYVILDKLGQGGMGQVLKAEHRRMRRTVALKVISGPSMKDTDAIRRFQREVHAAARLIHPNIVTAFDANEHEGVHFFVMEYVEGRDLAELVNDEGPLPVAQAVDYVLQAARGLVYAHGKGIVHRDIKPGNLLIDDEGAVKILDMGLARMELSADDGQELTNTGQVMGTVDYMAPEQAEDTHAVDARADIYSLGCTLYRLLAGQPLYSADTIVKKLLAHRSKPIPTLGDVRTGVPAALEATFQKMVAKRPEDRQPTMAHVVSELEMCLRDSAPCGTLPGSDEPTADFPLSDIVSRPNSGSGKSSSAAVAPRTEKTQTAATEVTQDFTKGDTGVSLGVVGWDKAAPAAAGPPSRGAGASRALTSSSLKSRLTQHRLPLLIAAALVSLALLAAGIVVFLPTADGTIRIEINDPSVEVTVAASGYTIKGKTEEIHIKPGEHTLHIKTGDLEFDTQQFTLGKGKNPAVKVELLDAKVQVVGAGGKILGEKSRVAVGGPAEPKPVVDNAASAVVASPRVARFALEFDGIDDHVEIPLPGIEQDSPITIEAIFTPRRQRDESDRPLEFIVHWAGPPDFQLALGRGTVVPPGYQRLSARLGRSEGIWFLEQPVKVGERQHVALVASQGAWRLFLDGNLIKSQAKPLPPVEQKKPTPNRLHLGATTNLDPAYPRFLGSIEEIRISSHARYQSNFTPLYHLDAEADTLALYHFDEGQGDTLIDSSDNVYHGKIVGAKWVPAAEPSATSPPNSKSPIPNQKSTAP
jgi:serine/threonine protein kinase